MVMDQPYYCCMDKHCMRRDVGRFATTNKNIHSFLYAHSRATNYIIANCHNQLFGIHQLHSVTVMHGYSKNFFLSILDSTPYVPNKINVPVSINSVNLMDNGSWSVDKTEVLMEILNTNQLLYKVNIPDHKPRLHQALKPLWKPA